jgi:hypothetical protein
MSLKRKGRSQILRGNDVAFLFFPLIWGGSSTQAWMPTYVSILRIPQMIVWRATVEWHIDRVKPKNSEKNLSSVTFSTTNPIWIEPWANPGLRAAKPATNDLSHGKAMLPSYLLQTRNLNKLHIFWRRITAHKAKTLQVVSARLVEVKNQLRTRYAALVR